ncbi:hypothetical protein DPMN_165909 [Dreissena polymorpha]|uniref:Uncharacterized protein n=1 Tax=Dreissena polymorpha TaxID=45954 RepID=A0A9D4EW77_DREPO|nr:hypothetical protein DPMN_165909 [Dreissena polymorpha]
MSSADPFSKNTLKIPVHVDPFQTACRVIYNAQLVEIVDQAENAFLVNESTLRNSECA